MEKRVPNDTGDILVHAFSNSSGENSAVRDKNEIPFFHVASLQNLITRF